MGSVSMFWDNIGFTDMSLLQMSFSSAVMILVISVVRALAINKLPKKVFVLLWGTASIADSLFDSFCVQCIYFC